MGFNDYLYQYAPGNLQAANLGWQKSQQNNPLADVLKMVIGATAGGISGGPLGAILGGAKGLGMSSNPDVAGVAQAGLTGYETGTQDILRNKFATALQNSNMDADTKNILSIASQDPTLGKEIFSEYAKSKLKSYDPMTLLLLKSMGIDPTKINSDTMPPEGTMDIDTETSKPIIVKNGKWEFVGGAK